jgi:hypothetical protein
MSLAKTLPTAILDTILSYLTTLFLPGTAGDFTAARRAAGQMLAAYQPQTEDELRLAAAIVSFSLQALDSLSQAASPDLPLTKILRLRGSAVSLSRESDKAQRRLEHLQQTHRQTEAIRPKAIETEAIRPEAARPEAAQTEATRPEAEPPPAPASAKLTWTQAYEQRQRDQRIAASLKRAEARVAAHQIPPTATASPSA